MNVVLIHIGDNLPDYFWDCCEQVRRFYPGKIYTVIPIKYIYHPEIPRIGIDPYPIEKLYTSILYEEFLQLCPLKDFWNVTMGRLILLQVFMQELNLTDVLHIENDVLIYRNPIEMLSLFEKLGNNSVVLTPVGPNHASAAYMYCRNVSVLNKMNMLFMLYFKKGPKHLEKMFGKINPSEMEMICYFKKHHFNTVHYLPIAPCGQWSFDFPKFKSVFDGASLGQYIGGTRTDGPGWAGNHHYIGRDLLSGNYRFVWEDDNGIKCPYMITKNKVHLGSDLIKINNLHIHCKNLKKYMY